MIWVFIIAVLLAVIITIIFVSAHQARGQASVEPKTKEKYGQYSGPEYRIEHCGATCKFAQEKGNKLFWCTKHTVMVENDDICQDSLAMIAKVICDLNGLDQK